ncbi:uncharacterized protein [Anabrus simplex]|uniref:uncharacterized protein n=1 Tax=Anabrus simplex TaxID=316456 RepID=UPI0035A30A6E
MAQEVKIKEEPVWLEGTTNASLENIRHISDVIALKKEAKSELTEPEPTQENSLEPSNDIKEKIFIEQHTICQLIPYMKEEIRTSVEVWSVTLIEGAIYMRGSEVIRMTTAESYGKDECKW